jgi:predicted nucleic acid-binding protein
VRVVFDTNIYISAFAIPGGQAEEAYLNALQGRFELFTSVPILTETTTVLQSKFDWAEEKTRELVQAISRVASVVQDHFSSPCSRR